MTKFQLWLRWNSVRLAVRHAPSFLRDYIAAAREYPAGTRCGWCRRPNFFCDDCGWIACTPEGDDTRVTCKTCYHGSIGERHIARYGVGER